MILEVPIDSHVPESVVSDVKKIISGLLSRGGKLRVVEIPYNDLGPILDKLVIQHPYPFKPTLCGVPVQFGIDREISVTAVWDDNTNTQSQINKEQEIWRP